MEPQGSISIFLGKIFLKFVAGLTFFYIGYWLITVFWRRRSKISIKTKMDVSIVELFGCLPFIVLFLIFFIVNNYIY
jgi:hypothetical protein